MKKNLLLVFISIFITFLLIYFLLFIKTFLEKNHKSEYLFKSRLSLEFHEKYSNILNHLRNSNQDWDFDGNQNNFLFSIINDLNKSNKNVLWQGDSWIEQINLENASLKSIIQYSKKNNFGMINAGITSFSPTLMKFNMKF